MADYRDPGSKSRRSADDDSISEKDWLSRLRDISPLRTVWNWMTGALPGGPGQSEEDAIREALSNIPEAEMPQMPVAQMKSGKVLDSQPPTKEVPEQESAPELEANEPSSEAPDEPRQAVTPEAEAPVERQAVEPTPEPEVERDASEPQAQPVEPREPVEPRDEAPAEVQAMPEEPPELPDGFKSLGRIEGDISDIPGVLPPEAEPTLDEKVKRTEQVAERYDLGPEEISSYITNSKVLGEQAALEILKAGHQQPGKQQQDDSNAAKAEQPVAEPSPPSPPLAEQRGTAHQAHPQPDPQQPQREDGGGGGDKTEELLRDIRLLLVQLPEQIAEAIRRG